MRNGTALQHSFRGTANEVGPVKPAFEPSHVGIIHTTPHEHATHDNDNVHKAVHAGAQNDAANYTSMGHFMGWLRETRAYRYATTKIDDLMRKGLMRTMSYLDVNGILGREASNTPSRNPLSRGTPALDGPEPE